MQGTTAVSPTLKAGVQAFSAGQILNLVCHVPIRSDCTEGSSHFSQGCEASMMTITPFLHGLPLAMLHMILLDIPDCGNPRVHFNDIQTLFL